ncbi:MAG: hypothetical protein GX892_15425 [Thermoanaerobacteraceae bacterium]|nr:hypothetical protein [Thermoanaerobacteraceae bacterium]
MTGLLSQLHAFLLTLVLGLITGVIFHYYQGVIRTARISRYVLYALDFFLWIFIIVLVFLVMLFINQGEMRVYVLIALVLGILLYYRCLSRRLERVISAAAQVTVTICSCIYGYLKKAIKWTISRLALLKPRPPEPPADAED